MLIHEAEVGRDDEADSVDNVAADDDGEGYRQHPQEHVEQHGPHLLRYMVLRCRIVGLLRPLRQLLPRVGHQCRHLLTTQIGTKPPVPNSNAQIG